MNKFEISKSVESFIKFLEIEEKSIATINKYKRDLKYFINWLSNTEITKATVIKYKEYLLEKYKPRSVNSMVAALNCFFKFSKCFDLVIKPVKIQKQPFRNQKVYITRKEYQKMVNKTKDIQSKMLILTLANLGIRVSEVKYLTVEAVREKEMIIYNKGKSRIVYIPKVLRKELLKYCKRENLKNGSIFINREGRPLNRVTIWRKIKKAAKESGVSETKAFPHNLRHLYAVTFYKKNKDVDLLATILGHSSIDTTRIYIQEDKLSYIKKIEQAFSTT